jgi:hypothetical protein
MAGGTGPPHPTIDSWRVSTYRVPPAHATQRCRGTFIRPDKPLGTLVAWHRVQTTRPCNHRASIASQSLPPNHRRGPADTHSGGRLSEPVTNWARLACRLVHGNQPLAQGSEVQSAGLHSLRRSQTPIGPRSNGLLPHLRSDEFGSAPRVWTCTASRQLSRTGPYNLDRPGDSLPARPKPSPPTPSPYTATVRLPPFSGIVPRRAWLPLDRCQVTTYRTLPRRIETRRPRYPAGHMTRRSWPRA